MFCQLKSLSSQQSPDSALCWCFFVFQCFWWPVSLLSTWDQSTSNTSATKPSMWVKVEFVGAVCPSLTATIYISQTSVCAFRMSWTETAVSHGLLNFSPTGLQSVSPSPPSMLICLSSKTPSSEVVSVSWRHTASVSVSFFCFRYNCAGLKFGKVDIGRYGEVSKK